MPPQLLPSVPIFSSLSFDQDLGWSPPWHRSPPVTLTSGCNIIVLGQIMAMCRHPMVGHCPNLDHCHLLCHLVLTPSPVVQPLATSAAANLAVLHPFEPSLVLMIFYIVRFAISILTQLVRPSRLQHSLDLVKLDFAQLSQLSTTRFVSWIDSVACLFSFEVIRVPLY